MVPSLNPFVIFIKTLDNSYNIGIFITNFKYKISTSWTLIMHKSSCLSLTNLMSWSCLTRTHIDTPYAKSPTHAILLNFLVTWIASLSCPLQGIVAKIWSPIHHTCVSLPCTPMFGPLRTFGLMLHLYISYPLLSTSHFSFRYLVPYMLLLSTWVFLVCASNYVGMSLHNAYMT